MAPGPHSCLPVERWHLGHSCSATSRNIPGLQLFTSTLHLLPASYLFSHPFVLFSPLPSPLASISSPPPLFLPHLLPSSSHQTLHTFAHLLEIHPHQTTPHSCHFSSLKSQHIALYHPLHHLIRHYMTVVLCAALASPTNGKRFSDKTLIQCFFHILPAPRTFLGKEGIQ